ncbi:MAG: hypothetical protein H0X31_00990 [Nostocaceae cyanobacterium]|nr:hypothetical protein [Nostocaceae cyanobacterium]
MSTDLFEAIKTHNLNQIADLLSCGADSNALCPDWPRWTLLHEAIEQLEIGSSIEVIVLLLRHGTSVNVWDEKHDTTPLLMALFRRQAIATRMLLTAGAETNVVSKEGDLPLRWCVERGDDNTAAMLLRCGATRTIDSAGGSSGMTALGRAANQLDLRMIHLLLLSGADPDALDTDRCTAYQRLPPGGNTKNDGVWLAAEILKAL